MPSEVHTGGLKKFVYPKDHKPKEDFDLKEEINKGYQQYYERKKRENVTGILIVLLIVVAILGFLMYKFVF